MTKLELAKKWVDEAKDSDGKELTQQCLSILERLLTDGCTATTCGMRYHETRKEFFDGKDDPTK